MFQNYSDKVKIQNNFYHQDRSFTLAILYRLICRFNPIDFNLLWNIHVYTIFRIFNQIEYTSS